jgi:hypothetical protein
MIEIITSDGISLDLSPNAEFSLEMENPIFSSDTMPAAFSTQITFAPTEKNCSALNYIAAMMLAPEVKSLKATLYFNGFPLMEGKLIYESIEEGELNYTFTGIDYSVDFNQKICDLPHVIESLRQVPINKSVQATIGDWISGNLDTDHSYAPVMIDQAYTETFDFSAKDVARKYINYPYDDSGENRVEMPVFPLAEILAPVLSRERALELERNVFLFYRPLCIVGQYRLSAKKEIGNQNQGARVDLASYLPDVTFLDLIKVLCGVFCSHIYQSGQKLLMVKADTILSSSNTTIRLDEKVSDSFSSGFEAGKKYVLGWSGDVSNTYSIDNLELDIADGDVIPQTGNLRDIVLAKDYDPVHPYPDENTEGYAAVHHSRTGQIFSVKKDGSNTPRRYLIDAIYLRHEDYSSGAAEETCEVRIPGAPVKTVPINIPHIIPDNPGDTDRAPFQAYRIAPVITIPDKSERGTDILIGFYGDGQLSDLGIVIDPYNIDHRYDIIPTQATDKEILNRISLSPTDLFEAYHKRFAAWMARDRQTVTVALNLTPAEIASWRLYNRFYFRGRTWLCKKLTVTFAAGVDRMESEGEFVEL